MQRAVSWFVDDGYWLKGSIPEMPGVHAGMDFEFRPMTYPERKRYYNAPPAQQDDADTILTHCRNFVPVTGVTKGDQVFTLAKEQVAKLHANLGTGLMNHALGLVGPSQAEAEKN